MRRVASGLTALATVVAMAACSPGTSPDPPRAASPQGPEYLVFYTQGGQRQAQEAVERAGGATLANDAKLGYLTATGGGGRFVENVGSDGSVVGVSPDRSIGFAEPDATRAARRTGGAKGRTAAFPDAGAKGRTAAFPDAGALTRSGSGE
ncbi:hypothetical protein AB0392_59500, partial [Nonomuraea angiospora]